MKIGDVFVNVFTNEKATIIDIVNDTVTYTVENDVIDGMETSEDMQCFLKYWR